MPRQDTKLESEGAEFLVLGQLLIERIPAYKSYTNQSGHDLVAAWEDSHRSARIQVKSRWETNPRHFTIKPSEFDFVVFVKLHRGSLTKVIATKDPEFYIMSISSVQGLFRDPDRLGYVLCNNEAFARSQNRWGRVKDFLKIPQNRKPAKAK